MPLTNYQKGDHFEKRVLGDLQAQGYVGWQSRVSRGAADIIALKPDQILLVQVKSGRQQIGHDEWNQLYDLAMRLKAGPILATREARKINYRRLTGSHQPRSPYWPCEPFLLDEVIAP